MANASAAMPDTLQPTWIGFILTTRDVCLLMEMVLSGRLPHVPRRPHERERPEIIKSGNIFIYEESVSGVKRWTDGVNWSPSRILGNFLLYREMEAGYPGEGSKKVALKKNRAATGSKPTGIRKNRSPNDTIPASVYAAGYTLSSGTAPVSYSYAGGENELCHLEDRQLIGSLTDSYPFVEDGLVKKTITLSVGGVPHHVVSYYRPAHVRSGALKTPSMEPSFSGINPRENLLRNSAFRVPVEQEEYKINENSEAYITHAQAQAQAQAQAHVQAQTQAQVQGLYQQPQQQQQQVYQPQPQPPQQQAYHPRSLSVHSQHGLAEHGLPTAGMAGMQTFGQLPFSVQAHPSALQGASQFSPHPPAPLTGSLQGIAQNGMEAIGSGNYQQPSQQPSSDGFAAGEPEAYGFSGRSSGQSTYIPAQNNPYTPTQANAYTPVHDSAYAPTQDTSYTSTQDAPYTPANNAYTSTNSAYTPTQSSGYVPPPPPPSYPAPRDYRQNSVATVHSGYMPALPESTPANPSPPGRDLHDVAGLQGDTKSESADWTPDYTNNTQDHHGTNSLPAQLAVNMGLNIPSGQSAYTAQAYFDQNQSMLQPVQAHPFQPQAGWGPCGQSGVPQIPALDNNNESGTPESTNSPITPSIPPAAQGPSSASGSFSVDNSAAASKGGAVQDLSAYSNSLSLTAADEAVNSNDSWVDLSSGGDHFTSHISPLLADLFAAYPESDNLAGFTSAANNASGPEVSAGGGEMAGVDLLANMDPVLGHVGNAQFRP